MSDVQFDRRQLLGTGAGLLAFTAMPAYARRGRHDNVGWEKVQALFDGYVADNRLPGAVGAMAHGTDDASFIVSGKIARDEPRAMDADSLFRVYSMTKPITGVAAMMLIEEGKLGLDQNIADFMPAFKSPRVLIDPMKDLSARPSKSPITVRNLLTHTAGLRGRCSRNIIASASRPQPSAARRCRASTRARPRPASKSLPTASRHYR
jgi:CubicO group peptidase (beta-lactamase class C family)